MGSYTCRTPFVYIWYGYVCSGGAQVERGVNRKEGPKWSEPISPATSKAPHASHTSPQRRARPGSARRRTRAVPGVSRNDYTRFFVSPAPASLAAVMQRARRAGLWMWQG